MKGIIEQLSQKKEIEIIYLSKDEEIKNNFLQVKYYQLECSLKVISLDNGYGSICQTKLEKVKNTLLFLKNAHYSNMQSIVIIKDDFIIDTNYYIITEKLNQQYKGSQYIAKQRKLQLIGEALQMLQSIKYLHENQYLIGDISKDDLYITENQTIKLFCLNNLHLNEGNSSEQYNDNINKDTFQSLLIIFYIFGTSEEDFQNAKINQNTILLVDHQINKILIDHYVQAEFFHFTCDHLIGKFQSLQHLLNKEISDVKEREISEKRFQYVLELFEKRQLKEIFPILNDLIKEQPENDMYLAWLGRVYFAQENIELSIQYSEQSIKINPNNYITLFNLGNIASEKQDIEKAISFYNKSIENQPHNYSSLFNLALEFQSQSEFCDAIFYYKLALLENSSKDQLLYNLGYCYLEINEIDIAIFYLKKSSELNPKKDISLFQLGVAYSKKQMFDQSILYYHKSLELDSKCDITLYNIGNTYLELNKLFQGVYFYKKSLSINQKKHSALNNLAYVYLQQEKFEKSIYYFAKSYQEEQEIIYENNFKDSKMKI